MRNPTLGRHALNAQQSAHPELWQEPAGFWVPALGNQGGALFDVSRNNNHGVLTLMDPSTDWVRDDHGYALDFDGVNDYVKIPNSPSLNYNSFSAITISVWVRPSSLTPNMTVFSQWGSFSNRPVMIELNEAANKWAFITNAYSGATRSTTIPLVGRWDFIVGTWDGGVQKIYINGVLEATDSTVQSVLDTSTSDNAIGARSTNGSFDEHFTGKIRSVCVHNRVLAGSEIVKLYLDPLAPFRLRQTPPVFVSGGGGTAVSKSIETFLESIAPVGKSVPSVVESAASLSQNLATATETSSSVAAAHLTALEFALSLEKSVQSNSEFLAEALQSAITPFESLSVGIPISNAIETQIISSQAQTSLAVTAIELLGTTAKQSSVRLESTATLSTSNRSEIETLSFTQNQSSTQMENMAGQASSRQTSYEARGTDTVVSNAIRTEICLSQSIQSAAATGAETHHSLSVQAVSRLESRGEILSGRVSGIEAGGSVQGMIETEYAYLTLVSQAAGVPIETLLGLSAPLMTSLEAAGSLAPVVGEIIIDGNFAMDISVDANF